MENDLEVGVADCVLLNEVSEHALVKNIQERFVHNRIYTFIGKTIISVNPYKSLPIYEKEYIELYRGANTFERPPHVYSLAETAFTNMRDKNIDQCVIISGESGAGKTETSKVLMKYISAVSGSSQRVDGIKDQLLNSNPCLEAFGNAKTLRNDNSSRFGKYMDLEFDYKGMPCGGRVTTYLLEKSRVTSRLDGERAFHIFYQILRGSDLKLLAQLELSNDPSHYTYLRQSNCDVIQAVDDASQFEQVCTAMDRIGISKEDRFALFEGVAAVLHLGNIQFEVKQNHDPAVPEAAGTSVRSQVANREVLAKAANRLGVAPNDLEYSMTHRLIRDNAAGGNKHFEVPLTPELAHGARDSFARSLYGRLFEWLVGRLNERIASITEHSATIKFTAKKNVIGVVDIYGFEVFHRNGMDQLLINYCNERLQQLFIELTLKSEQDEYANEGIAWTHIDYFNNKTIVDLMENKKTGIISVLDEECVLPGETSDATFLSKLDAINMKHAHYDSYAKSRGDKCLQASKGAFRLKHYAGDVTYEVEGFLEKNKDALNKDLIRAMGNSTKMTVQELFPESSLAAQNLRRPETLAVQFKYSMQKLTENLASKQPHYVRCIKPNLEKKHGLVDADLVTHQVQYLGLLENVKIRRAGFCYRQKFGDFVTRYKMLSDETWPHWKGDDKQGVSTILIQNGVPDDGKEFVFGSTKVFIKNPLTLFRLENKRTEVKQELATAIQAVFKGYRQRRIYLTTLAAATKIESLMRMRIQYKKYQRVLKAVTTVAKLWRGCKARKEYKCLRRKLPKYACSAIQRAYRLHRARLYLAECAKAARTAGGHWMRIPWPVPGKLRCLKTAESVLFQMYRRVMAKKYRKGLSEAQRASLEWKLVVSNFFNRKSSYKESIQKSFIPDHIGLADSGRAKQFDGKLESGEPVLSAIPVNKLNRSNLQWDCNRVLVLTDRAVYMFMDNMALKERVPLSNVLGCSASTFKDGVFVIHCTPDEKKGDVIVCSDAHCLEFVGRLYMAVKAKVQPPKIEVAESFNYSVRGKSMKMIFSAVTDPKIKHLSVQKVKGDVAVLVPE